MFEVFKIGFLTVTFSDILDISLVSVLIYKLYTSIRGTIAAQIFFGLVLVILLSFLAQIANFKAVGWLLRLISDIWVIAFIILFQPEIRRFLVMFGRNTLFRRFLFKHQDRGNTAEILTDAAFEMAQHQHGALIVVIKTSDIKGVAETGEEINSKLSKNLIRNLFFPRSPMHDGAVIVKNGIIEAAKCTLPLSQATVIDGISLGMRHRAGLGITEQADVLSIIVSEETGSISLAEKGNLVRGLSKERLKNLLNYSLEVNINKSKKPFLSKLLNKK